MYLMAIIILEHFSLIFHTIFSVFSIIQIPEYRSITRIQFPNYIEYSYWVTGIKQSELYIIFFVFVCYFIPLVGFLCTNVGNENVNKINKQSKCNRSVHTESRKFFVPTSIYNFPCAYLLCDSFQWFRIFFCSVRFVQFSGIISYVFWGITCCFICFNSHHSRFWLDIRFH